jgi:hypothetical protein
MAHSRWTVCVWCMKDQSGFELLQLFYGNRRCIRQATRQASVSESDGLGFDGDLETAGNSLAHRSSWRGKVV